MFSACRSSVQVVCGILNRSDATDADTYEVVDLIVVSSALSTVPMNLLESGMVAKQCIIFLSSIRTTTPSL